MKKIACSFVAASLLFSSVALAEDNGGFIGLSIGGGAALSVSGQDSASSSTAVAAGFRGGYQAFFTEASGVRFYFSLLAAYGVFPNTDTGTNTQVPLLMDLYALADINADYLFNWAVGAQNSAGLFVGFFTGGMLSLPQMNVQKVSDRMTTGVTFGLNLGLRTTINDHHQVEFGVKSGANFLVAKAFTMGAIITGLATYAYKF